MLIEGIGQIFGIGNEGYETGFGKGFKSDDGTEEFHAVVGGEFVAAGVACFVKGAVFVDIVKDSAITAGARVSF